MRAEEGASWSIQFKLKQSDRRQSSLLEQSRFSFGFHCMMVVAVWLILNTNKLSSAEFCFKANWVGSGRSQLTTWVTSPSTRRRWRAWSRARYDDPPIRGQYFTCWPITGRGRGGGRHQGGHRGHGGLQEGLTLAEAASGQDKLQPLTISQFQFVSGHWSWSRDPARVSVPRGVPGADQSGNVPWMIITFHNTHVARFITKLWTSLTRGWRHFCRSSPPGTWGWPRCCRTSTDSSADSSPRRMDRWLSLNIYKIKTHLLLNYCFRFSTLWSCTRPTCPCLRCSPWIGRRETSPSSTESPCPGEVTGQSCHQLIRIYTIGRN